LHHGGDTARQGNYEWSNAAIYIPLFTGGTFCAFPDKNQPNIFRTRAICGDKIASYLPRCATGTGCRDSSKFYLPSQRHNKRTYLIISQISGYITSLS